VDAEGQEWDGWRRSTCVADPSPEGFTAWRRERERLKSYE